MGIKFTKMHGCGNDYVYINCFENDIPNKDEVAIKLSHRNFGVGSDGVIYICPSEVADAKMRMFNLDGSEGKMCGNGIRCVAKYIYDNNIAKKDVVTIETLSGIKTLEITAIDGIAKTVKVDMGAPILEGKLIPTTLCGEKIVGEIISVAGNKYSITAVSMGNPHCIVFCDEIQSLNLEKIGPLFEKSVYFPENVNTEFVKIIDSNTVEMRVWERGSGETLACGTGACAVAVACVLNGFLKKNTDITVKLLGGELVINYTDDTVFMTGSAVSVFSGEMTD